MGILICNSSIKEVIALLKRKKDQRLKREEVIKLVNHKDYLFEFERYKNRITQEEFIEYFLNFDQFKDIQIKNEDLRIHHKYWLDFFQNIELYENKINEFFMRFDEEIMSYAYNLAKKSFPKTYQFNDFELVFTCGIGQSYGYPYKNSMHFDILQLIKEHKTQEFQYALAHEIHHLFFNQNIKPEEENLEGYFLQCFAGEGLAIHFTNNAEGVLSKRMNPNISKNLGIDNDSMNYLNHHFEETYYEFKQTITKIRNHEIKTIDEINNLIFGYWLDCYIEGQNHEETPYLKQSRLYSLGNELWGVIYDVYGMDGLYEIVNNPKMFVDKFNVALQKINKKELCI